MIVAAVESGKAGRWLKITNDDGNDSTAMMRFISQMLKLPITALVYSFEMVLKTMQGLQRMADESIDGMIGVESRPNGGAEGGRSQTTSDAPANGITRNSGDTVAGESKRLPESLSAITSGAVPDNAQTTQKEKRIMDKDLHDDMLKLVRYKVLFVRREYEHAFPEREDLVPDNMDGTAFTAWKTAEFIQELGRKETRIPEKWKGKRYPSPEFVEGDYLKGLPDEDKKYLRVYYEVLERYPREKFKYEEQQIRVLEEIRDKI